MIYEVFGIATCIAWNEAVFPNSHWGMVSFSSSRFQTQISEAQTSPGALSVSGRQSKSRRSELVCTRWGSMAQRASCGQDCLATALSMLDEGCRTHTSAGMLHSYCVWAQTAPCPRAECCLQPARALHDLFFSSHVIQISHWTPQLSPFIKLWLSFHSWPTSSTRTL